MSSGDARGLPPERDRLRGRDLSHADLRDADLRGLDLEGANLRRADLARARLDGANLTGANLSFANLVGASLNGTVVSGATMMGASLLGAAYDEGGLSGADTFGAALDGHPRELVVATLEQLQRVAWLCEGELLLTNDGAGHLAIWDAYTADQLRVLDAKVTGYRAIDVRPDGRLIAAAVPEGVGLIDPVSGRVVTILQTERPSVCSISFSPDGERIAAVEIGGTTRIWDLKAKAPLAVLRDSGPAARVRVAFAPDGARLATAVGRHVRVWDVESRQERASIAVKEPCAAGLAWSADGSRIYGASERHTVDVIDVDTKLVTSQKVSIGFECIAFNDGLAAVGGQRLGLVDLSADRLVRTFERERTAQGVRGVAVRPDGGAIAEVSGGAELAIWDVQTGERLRTMRAGGDLIKGATVLGDLTREQKLPSFPAKGCGWAWDLDLLEAEKIADDAPQAPVNRDAWRMHVVSRAADGVVATLTPIWDADRQHVTGHAIVVTDAPSGEVMATIDIGALLSASWALSYDGRWLAIHNRTDQRLVIHEPRSGRVHAELPFSSPGNLALDFRRDGAEVCLASGGVQILDMKTVNVVSQWSTDDERVVFARWSADGTVLVTSSLGGVMRVWDTATRSLRGTLGCSTTGWESSGPGRKYKRWGSVVSGPRYSIGFRCFGVEELAALPTGSRALAHGEDNGALRVPVATMAPTLIGAAPPPTRIEPLSLRSPQQAVERGSALWSRRWTSTNRLSINALTTTDAGDAVLAGHFSGAVRWGDGCKAETEAGGAYCTVLDRDGEAKRCRVIGGAGWILWLNLASRGDATALALTFQGSVTIDGDVHECRGVQDVLVLVDDAATGSIRFARRLGERGMTKCCGLRYGSSGRLFVAGEAEELALSSGRTSGAGRSLFIAGLDPGGVDRSIWWTGGARSYMHKALLGADDSLFLSGHFQGEVDFGGGIIAAGERRYIAKLDPNGNHVFSGGIGASMGKTFLEYEMSSKGEVFACGICHGALDFGGATYPPTSTPDLVLAKLDPDGGAAWVRRFEVPPATIAYHSVMSNGSLLVAGTFTGTLDFGVGAMKGVGTGRNATPYLASFAEDGRAQWSRCFGDGEKTYFYAMAPSPDGTALVAGSTDGSLDLGAGEMPASGRSDVFLARISL